MPEAEEEGLVTVIMAAGKGTRMKSDMAKVLHTLHGKPMVCYAIEAAQRIGSDRTIVIVGHQAPSVKSALAEYAVEFAEQREQMGTGHAVMQAEPLLRDFDGTLLVLAGDTPLIKAETLQTLCTLHRNKKAAATILTATISNPYGLGRIIRDEEGQVRRIVEEKDASEEEKKIREVNSSIYCFDAKRLFDALSRIRPDNKQGELYLTDTISILRESGGWIAGAMADDPDDTTGINTVEHLEAAARILDSRNA
ncbi:MAG: NTP transferase domain-containing protein [Candidatus Latescibacteria bacterium]|nr:NTP transferase domain-containing protein [Candidatus Latescibacterota bacterium]